MKIRIKFTKTGPLKYIGHLDVMRFFQKLLRRAQIPVAFSEGFSPHPILSFSPPLSLGAESLGEYADIEITSLVKSSDAIDALNKNTVDGIKIESFKQLNDKTPNAMASVAAADYICSLKDDKLLTFDFKKEFTDLFMLDEINIIKKTKKNESVVNIRPFILSYSFPDDKSLYLRLTAGSVDNLKPVLVFEALFNKLGLSLPENPINITRVDLLCKNGDGALISLNEVGSDI